MSPTPTTFHSRSLLKTIQMIMPAADARGRVDSRDASSLLRPSAFKLPELVASAVSSDFTTDFYSLRLVTEVSPSDYFFYNFFFGDHKMPRQPFGRLKHRDGATVTSLYKSRSNRAQAKIKGPPSVVELDQRLDSALNT